MITELILGNFKGFKKETTIPLSKLNIFTGANGSGKSSAIQAMLLIAQKEGNEYLELPIIGKRVNLLSFDNIKHVDNTESEPIIFGLTVDKIIDTKNKTSQKITSKASFIISPENGNKRLLFNSLEIDFHEQKECKIDIYFGVDSTEFKTQKIIFGIKNEGSDANVVVSANDNIVFEFLNEPQQLPEISSTHFARLGLKSKADLLWFGENNSNNHYSSFNIPHQFKFLYYVPSKRIGPQLTYSVFATDSFTDLGEFAEKTMSLIADTPPKNVLNDKLLLGENKFLIVQIEAWLSYIFDDLKFEIKQSNPSFIDVAIDGFNPTMVGFGYSYLIPILYAGLMSKHTPNNIVIIENPELHLTPKSQARLMEFLCKVADSGVQVFLETHSDHIVNGARVMARKYYDNKRANEEDETRVGLSHEDISILWFEKDKETRDTTVQQVELQPTGKLSHAPKGFFDQMNNDMRTILGFPE